MFTVEEFNTVCYDQQREVTFLKGEFFDVNSTDEYLISLYYYNSFIIEVHYNALNNEIDKFEALSLFDAADKYIDIAELMTVQS